jgi:hypothetical protein
MYVASSVFFEAMLQRQLQHRKHYYVDASTGSDSYDGLSAHRAFASIGRAAEIASRATSIHVGNGTYRNRDFGGQATEHAVLLAHLEDVQLIAQPGCTPCIEFDGASAISAYNVSFLEISGFRIVGSAARITRAEALAGRLDKSPRLSGRGIAVRNGHHVTIRRNHVQYAPGSGIRVDGGDYLLIEDNEVADCTWWTSSAESGLVVAEARDTDSIKGVKILLRGNVVHGNMNRVPYYNPVYPNKDAMAGHAMYGARSSYGLPNQTVIMDGSGMYLTRNERSYTHGRFELRDNVAFGNGISGIVVHRTKRVLAWHNRAYSNGLTPRNPPESRQPSGAMAIAHSARVTLYDNELSSTGDPHDFTIVTSYASFAICEGSTCSQHNVSGHHGLNLASPDSGVRIAHRTASSPPPSPPLFPSLRDPMMPLAVKNDASGVPRLHYLRVPKTGSRV